MPKLLTGWIFRTSKPAVTRFGSSIYLHQMSIKQITVRKTSTSARVIRLSSTLPRYSRIFCRFMDFRVFFGSYLVTRSWQDMLKNGNRIHAMSIDLNPSSITLRCCSFLFAGHRSVSRRSRRLNPYETRLPRMSAVYSYVFLFFFALFTRVVCSNGARADKKNSGKSRFLSPFGLEQIETACNNARNYADLLAADNAALTAFCVAFQDSTENDADFLAVDDAILVASRIAVQAYTKLASFFCDFKSPSGFLMDEEELVMGLGLTREWLDMAARRRDFRVLREMTQAVINNTVVRFWG